MIHIKLTEWDNKPAVEFDDGDIFYQSQTISEFLMHLSILMPNCELPDDIYICEPEDLDATNDKA